MLQQTQASRVVDAFTRFIDRFPTVEALAAADEQDVLAAWSGLGYYRRARNLHAAARAIVEEHDGRVPAAPEALRTLPGVGRYTAGAVASIVFGARTPLVDANVRRVLMRIDGIDAAADDPGVDAAIWRRAEELVTVCDDPGALNEGLMELGALVCTPRSPRCGACPVRRSCRASRLADPGSIPRPKPAPARRLVHHAAVIVRDRRGRVLVEQRPPDGLWASMWQAPTIESADAPPSAAALQRAIGVASARRAGSFDHQTTHRLVRFWLFRGRLAAGRRPSRGRFVTAADAAALPMATPHRRILEEA